MKKIPIILSSAALLTSGTVAAATTAIPASVENLSRTPFSLSSLDLNSLNDSEGLITNHYPAGTLFKITAFNFSRNTVGLRDEAANTQKALKKLVIAYRNYEEGITEEVADSRALELGADDVSDWGVLALDLEFPEGNNIGLLQMKPTEGIRFEDNLTDIVYFAALYADKVNDDDGGYHFENEVWERGKLDYRSCIHSSVFRRLHVTCNLSDYNEDVTYVPTSTSSNVVVPEGEVVIDWETEWRDAQRSTLNKTIQNLTLLDQKIDQADEILDNADATLMKLLKTMPQSGGLDTEIIIAKEWQKAIQLIRNLLAVDRGDDTGNQELEQLRSEVTELLKTVQDLTDRNRSLDRGNELLSSENQDLVLENQRLKESINSLRGDNQALGKNVEALGAENRDLLDKIAQLEKDNQELSKRLSSAESDTLRRVEQLMAEKETVEARNTALVNEIQGFEAKLRKLEKEKQGLEVEKQALEVELQKIRTDNNIVSEKQGCNNVTQNSSIATGVAVTVDDAQSTEQENFENKDSLSMGDESIKNSDSEDVEVPNLGENGQQLRWWMLLPVIGLVVVGIVGLLRWILLKSRD